MFRDVFAGDVPRATTGLMWAGQRPVDVRALGEPSGAQRAGARTVEVGASHVAMMSQPAATADLIKRAAC